MASAILILTLIVSDAPIPIGQPVSVEIELRNVSDRSVWVPYVLDGSEEGARYPHFRTRVMRDGRIVAEPPPLEDPYYSPLRADDFHLLAPGATFNPVRAAGIAGQVPLFTFLNFRPDSAGLYEVSVTYSTESSSPEDWLGGFGQDSDQDQMISRIAEIPRLTLTASASVTVR